MKADKCWESLQRFDKIKNNLPKIDLPVMRGAIHPHAMSLTFKEVTNGGVL